MMAIAGVPPRQTLMLTRNTDSVPLEVNEQASQFTKTQCLAAAVTCFLTVMIPFG